MYTTSMHIVITMLSWSWPKLTSTNWGWQRVWSSVFFASLCHNIMCIVQWLICNASFVAIQYLTFFPHCLIWFKSADTHTWSNGLVCSVSTRLSVTKICKLMWMLPMHGCICIVQFQVVSMSCVQYSYNYHACHSESEKPVGRWVLGAENCHQWPLSHHHSARNTSFSTRECLHHSLPGHPEKSCPQAIGLHITPNMKEK